MQRGNVDGTFGRNRAFITLAIMLLSPTAAGLVHQPTQIAHASDGTSRETIPPHGFSDLYRWWNDKNASGRLSDYICIY